MGKATEKRKKNRIAFLSNLIENDPAKFEIEWERRLAGWIYEIRSSITKEGNMNGALVFSILDNAIQILSACGEKAILMHGKRTKDLLGNLCCMELSSHFGRELYRITAVWPEIPYGKNHIRIRKGGHGGR